MPLIFVSYRRQDTQSATGRLCDKLQQHFGADAVFHDVESIDAGSDFAATIAAKVAASSVVLVMIGRHWVDAVGSDGSPRLSDPNDFVRLEVAAALQRDIPVIPVLVEGAAVPPRSALPQPLADLSARQAHEITELRWQYDSDLLVKQLESFVPAEGAPIAGNASTLGQTLLQSVVAWPVDFAQLLVNPRRRLAALAKQPNAVPRALVFFTLAHLGAAWLFVLPDLVASVAMFVLQGVPLGAFILLVVMIPVHLAARLVRVPSHGPTTLVALAYTQSVAVLLIATGIAFTWTGLMLGNPEFGAKLRVAVNVSLPFDARMARIAEVAQASMGGAFFATFVLANVIWLFTAFWLVVASLAFRDIWRISWLRFAAILILVLLTLSTGVAVLTFAGRL